MIRLGPSFKQFNCICLCIVLVTLLASLSLVQGEEDLIVSTAGGKVKGITGTSFFTEKKFLQFLGIPYAKPPVDDLRFELPEPADSWDGVKDGSAFSSECVQINYDDGEVIGSEDCLYLNVFTPSVKKGDGLRSVIVLLHGGSFQFEHGGHYSPVFMMEEDIVLVTFNFRIGIFGFLSSGRDGVITGNLGLKDQVLALKWVRDNIRQFNGNPADVTLLGFSSGGAAVHLHMLSPLSQGLFHKAISQSGTALMPWVLTRNPEKRVTKLADLMKCTDESMESKKDCLKKADMKELGDKQGAFAEWYIDPIVPLGPVLENESSTAFLTKFPYEIIAQGDFHGKNIPWLLGVNSHEGLLHAADIVNHGMLMRVMSMEWDKVAPITLILKHASFDLGRLTETIKKQYFGDSFFINKTALDSIVNMYSDRYFYHGTRLAARLHAEKSAEDAPVYLYYFDRKGHNSIIHATNPRNKNLTTGVSHYDNVQYLFPTPDFEPLEEEQHEFARKFVRTMCEFAKTGAVSGWTATTTQDFQDGKVPQYNVIGTQDGAILEPFTERMKFWDSLGLMENGKELSDNFLANLISNAEEKANVTVTEKTESRDEL